MKYIPSILFCCLLIPCFGQVFPGDANNNGIVDHCDILPIGYAFGEVGPARLEESNEAYEQVVTVLWEEAFPDGNNYAHADANGDGIIDFMDLTTVFYNYDISYEETVPLPLISGTPGIDVPIYFDMPDLTEPLTAGSTLDIPLYLGTESIPVNNLHGLAFTIVPEVAKKRLCLKKDIISLGEIKDLQTSVWGVVQNSYTGLGKQ